MNFWKTEIDVFSLRGENQSSRGRFKQFVHFTPILNRESTQVLMHCGPEFIGCRLTSESQLSLLPGHVPFVSAECHGVTPSFAEVAEACNCTVLGRVHFEVSFEFSKVGDK